MPKKLSVEASDETHKQLCNLAAHYNLDVNKVINSVLTSVGKNEGNITQLSEISEPDKSLDSTLNATLGNYLTIAYLFNNVLRKVKAERQFEVDSENVEINWVDEYFRFRFDAATDDYSIDSIEVTKEDGSFNLSTYTSIGLEETQSLAFDELKEVAESFDNPFNIDDCRIHVDDSGEDFCDLVIDCWDESIENLPTVKQVDSTIKRILKKAKVQHEK